MMRSKGYNIIVGIDEAGRGPLAGPVVAACCHIPEGIFIAGVADSKTRTAEERAAVFEAIRANSQISYSVGQASHEEIDALNIFHATRLAMKRAIEAFSLTPDILLIDGMALPAVEICQEKVIGGDASSYCIAAASIIAKETRDAQMRLLDGIYPVYGFARHKGYATAAHREAIKKYGPSPIHRKSFIINKNYSETLEEFSDDATLT